MMLKKCVLLLACLVIIDIHAYQHGSSYPYISGDTFREFADHIFDPESRFDSKAVKEGDIIFVKGDLLRDFFSYHHPKIPARYILITHNSDESSPGLFKAYLDDSKIIKWFGQNADAYHDKFCPIPIGIANRCWPHGDTGVLSSIKKNALSWESCERSRLIYFNCEIRNNIAQRQQAYQLFSRSNFCYIDSHRSFGNYLNEMQRSIFVVSPHGNGLDCHRTWEALLMGRIPIVKSSTLDSLYKGLPVVIVNDWSEVTVEFLKKEYDKIISSGLLLETKRLFIDYWLNKIISYKPQ